MPQLLWARSRLKRRLIVLGWAVLQSGPQMHLTRVLTHWELPAESRSGAYSGHTPYLPWDGRPHKVHLAEFQSYYGPGMAECISAFLFMTGDIYCPCSVPIPPFYKGVTGCFVLGLEVVTRSSTLHLMSSRGQTFWVCFLEVGEEF